MAADNELENLKTDCITALRKGDEDAFDAAALKFQESSAGDLQFKMETLGLLACLALKQNYCRSALKALNLLSVCSLDIAPEDAQQENVFFQNYSKKTMKKIIQKQKRKKKIEQKVKHIEKYRYI